MNDLIIEITFDEFMASIFSTNTKWQTLSSIAFKF